MLTYFPTPYPDEWWYSVLSRYHVRSGNAKQQTTIRELFQESISAAIGAVYPNNTICRVVSQLPPGVFSAESIILQNTLFPYFTRCCTLAQKKDKLEHLLLGETAILTSIRRLQNLAQWTPQYCPRCAAEDQDAHGEAYWHITHQIPLLTLCPTHGYRLRTIPAIDPTRLKDTFHPLEYHLHSVVSNEEADEVAELWRLPLSRILAEYQSLPMEYGAIPSYSNLAITLSNMGYGVIQKHSIHTILDGKRLYRDLIEYYGRSMVNQVFGGEESVCSINRVCKWGMVTPERYALLQCFANITSETLFSREEAVPDQYQQKLTALSQSKVRYTKKQVAELLGVTQAQLDILLKRFGIPPFRPSSDEVKGSRKISFLLNDEELSEFKEALNASGFRFDSHFAKHCILSYIRRYGREDDTK